MKVKLNKSAVVELNKFYYYKDLDGTEFVVNPHSIGNNEIYCTIWFSTNSKHYKGREIRYIGDASEWIKVSEEEIKKIENNNGIKDVILANKEELYVWSVHQDIDFEFGYLVGVYGSLNEAEKVVLEQIDDSLYSKEDWSREEYKGGPDKDDEIYSVEYDCNNEHITIDRWRINS